MTKHIQAKIDKFLKLFEPTPAKRGRKKDPHAKARIKEKVQRLQKALGPDRFDGRKKK